MTAKHYRALAKALYQHPLGCNVNQFRELVEKIADVLASENPRFNRDTFINAVDASGQ